MGVSTTDNTILQQDSYVDWTGCDLVERVPGKVSGRPIVRGTRILADAIVQDFEAVLLAVFDPFVAAQKHASLGRMQSFSLLDRGRSPLQALAEMFD